MLEFYYDFLDKFCDRRDFEIIQMDTDSFYMALSANDFDDIIKPEMKELYKEEKKNWLVTDEYSKRVPGLFKAEFQGKRMIALTSKCYFADNGKDEGVKKFSCKGVSRRHNEMNWERYRKALFGSLDKARNIGFRKRDNHIQIILFGSFFLPIKIFAIEKTISPSIFFQFKDSVSEIRLFLSSPSFSITFHNFGTALRFSSK